MSAQYTPRVVAPGAERRPSWWIFSQLGRRLGLELPGAGARDQQLVTSREEEPVRETEHRQHQENHHDQGRAPADRVWPRPAGPALSEVGGERVARAALLK